MRIHAVTAVCILLSTAPEQTQAQTSLMLSDLIEMKMARTEASRLAVLDAQAVVTQAESIRAGHLPTVDPVIVCLRLHFDPAETDTTRGRATSCASGQEIRGTRDAQLPIQDRKPTMNALIDEVSGTIVRARGVGGDLPIAAYHHCK